MNGNGIKILSNAEGFFLIRMLESRSFEGTRVPPGTMATKTSIANVMPPAVTAPGSLRSALERSDRLPPALSMTDFTDSRTPDVKRRLLDEVTDKSKNWKLTEITDSGGKTDIHQFQCCCLALTSKALHKLCCLALTSNTLHKLWKWPRSNRKPSGKVMTTFMPPLPATSSCSHFSGHPQDNNIIPIGMEDSSIQASLQLAWRIHPIQIYLPA